MTISNFVRTLAVGALLVTITGLIRGNTLHGRVTEVVDGRTISLVSLQHDVRIKLIGVAPPDEAQRFQAEARKHLSDLILDKFVVVRYSGLGRDYIAGRVLLNEVDIGEQMIRDGVAWYDRSDGNALSEEDQQLYSACEKAARDEHRGLWQDPAPLSPWEFRKTADAELAKTNPYAATVSRPRSPARVQSKSAYSSGDLLGGFGGLVQPGSLAGKPDFKRISPSSPPNKWLRFRPEGENFSTLAPSDSVQVTYPVIDGQGKLVDVNYVFGTKDQVIYVLMWTKGSNDNATDASVANTLADGMVRSLNEADAKTGSRFPVSARPVRDLTIAGYSGKQFELKGDQISGVARVLSKQVDDQRAMFMLCVINSGDDPAAVNQFLNSFRINDD